MSAHDQTPPSFRQVIPCEGDTLSSECYFRRCVVLLHVMGLNSFIPKILHFAIVIAMFYAPVGKLLEQLSTFITSRDVQTDSGMCWFLTPQFIYSVTEY